MCCKSPSAVSFFERGDGALCRQSSINSICDRNATDVPLVLTGFALVFFDFPLFAFGVEVFFVAPFISPLVFLNFPLIFLVVSFGVNVSYSRKSISGVLQVAESYKLEYKINILVCCKSPSAINANGKLIFWCPASRQVP